MTVKTKSEVLLCMLSYYWVFYFVEKYPMIISTPHNPYHANAESLNRSTSVTGYFIPRIKYPEDSICYLGDNIIILSMKYTALGYFIPVRKFCTKPLCVSPDQRPWHLHSQRNDIKSSSCTFVVHNMADPPIHWVSPQINSFCHKHLFQS